MMKPRPSKDYGSQFSSSHPLEEKRTYHSLVDIIRRIAKNSILLLIARATDIVSMLIAISLVARYLGVNRYGTYAFVVSFISILTPAIYFGLNQILIRDISRNREAAGVILGASIIIRTVLSVVLVALVVIACQIIGPTRETIIAIYIFTLSELILSFGMLFDSIFIASERMEYDTFVTFAFRLCLLSGICLVVFLDLGFVSLFIAIGTASLVRTFLSFFWVCKKFVFPRFIWDTKYFWYLLRESYLIGIIVIFGQASFRIDVLILKAFRTIAEVGLFHGPHRLVLLLDIFPKSLVTALFPVLSRLAESSRQSLTFAFGKIFKFLVILSLPIAIGITLTADKIIALIFGNAFLPASPCLQILAWTIPVLFLNFLITYTLTSMNIQRFAAISMIICFSVNLILDLILVPQYGIIGASVATLFAYSTLLGVNFYFLSTKLGMVQVFDVLVKPIASAVVLAVFLYLVRGVDIIALILIGIFIYPLILFCLKTLSSEEMDVLKKSIRMA